MAQTQVESHSNNLPKLVITSDTRDECYTTKTTKVFSLKEKGLTIIEETECKSTKQGFQSEIYFI